MTAEGNFYSKLFFLAVFSFSFHNKSRQVDIKCDAGKKQFIPRAQSNTTHTEEKQEKIFTRKR
jgi:hypothetical protein